MFERIDNLVTKHGFSFQAWDDRYSKGVWAALGVWENQIDTVRDLSSDGDLDMIPAMEFVFSTGWLPYVTGRSLLEAMQVLENRLAELPADQLNRESDWATLVCGAIETLRDSTDGRSNYGEIGFAQLSNLPYSFEAALATIER